MTAFPLLFTTPMLTSMGGDWKENCKRMGRGVWGSYDFFELCAYYLLLMRKLGEKFHLWSQIEEF